MSCFFFKQKTAYEMRISDWSSDVCSSGLQEGADHVADHDGSEAETVDIGREAKQPDEHEGGAGDDRSEEHTSELQSLMRISYAVFCLKKKKTSIKQHLRGPHMPT